MVNIPNGVHGESAPLPAVPGLNLVHVTAPIPSRNTGARIATVCRLRIDLAPWRRVQVRPLVQKKLWWILSLYLHLDINHTSVRESFVIFIKYIVIYNYLYNRLH